MANSYDENAQGDSTHANHLTLDLLPSDQVTFSGTFTNYYDPTYGFTTDFDYFQVDLADLAPNGTLTVTFTPQDPNAYYYRILARIDTTENLALPYVLGSNSTWIVRDPVNSEHIDDTTNTAGATI